MILVDVFRDNDSKISQVKVSGHSGYEDVGKDIVCASVSTMMIQSINLLEAFGSDFVHYEDEQEVEMSIIIKSHDNASEKILNTLVQGLNDVSKGYKQFIKIKENRR